MSRADLEAAIRSSISLTSLTRFSTSLHISKVRLSPAAFIAFWASMAAFIATARASMSVLMQRSFLPQ